jgi:hypothetical protein
MIAWWRWYFHGQALKSPSKVVSARSEHRFKEKFGLQGTIRGFHLEPAKPPLRQWAIVGDGGARPTIPFQAAEQIGRPRA